ncbi:MAG: LysR family transcriptional regulator [Salinisphaera sp.]|jgi:DNA-binding transcriptional LysR family regulator|nr:LysR family transcriptional regulator [Salinisphaera sp.]
MRTDEIQAFIAVCDVGSFQAAAQTLHLSQPAVSKRLASLEDRLGHQLFDRVGRSITLTESGRAYLPHARALLAALADGHRALDNLAQEVSGPLRLALSHHVGLHRMPEVLRRYVATYPQVTPEIEFLDSEAACLAVARGDMELAVITLPVTPHPILTEQVIWNDPMAVFVGATHALARQRRITPADLGQWPAVLPPRDSTTYAIIEAALNSHDVVLDTRMTSHYLDTLRMLADVGLGWTVLPLSLALDGLTQLELPTLSFARRLGVVLHPQRQLSNAARAMQSLLHEERIASAIE